MPTFTYAGTTSTFSKRDGRFRVRTDGPDGALADFDVKYTFGVYPLQQYLIEFPDGRVQALSIAWDARPKKEGGQRWFHLYPTERVTHDDELHWTRPAQNWNYMCADCHSTGLQKNYEPARGSIQNELGRNQRQLRGLSRSRLSPSGMGAEDVRNVRLQPDRRRRRQGPDRQPRRTPRRHVDRRRPERKCHALEAPHN